MQLYHVKLQVFHYDLSQRMQVVEMVVVNVGNTDEDYFDAFGISQSWFEITY
jgi:hypothetical protein